MTGPFIALGLGLSGAAIAIWRLGTRSRFMAWVRLVLGIVLVLRFVTLPASRLGGTATACILTLYACFLVLEGYVQLWGRGRS